MGSRTASPTGKEGVTPGHIWDGMNLVAEMDSKGAVTGKYYRGLGLVYGEQAGQTQYYSMNAHGDVDMLSDASGNVIKTYEYDAFGVERNRDEADANPFRYAGEYYDGETDSIYLRARYYMPSMGRFTTEDPIRDGLNWYSYCSGNPVMFIDPLGLFDYNTTYRKGDKGKEIEVLQNELKWNQYVGADGNPLTVDGVFGANTEFAVRNFQRDRGLTVDGIVGKNTWSALGLIYRTQGDIDAGLKIVTLGRKQYFDVTIPVNNAVWNARGEFEEHKGDLKWFASVVGDDGKWNIKANKGKVWTKTLGITFPGYNANLLFFGMVVKVEDIGNITYGYLGKVVQISDNILIFGSMANHFKNHFNSGWANEFKDDDAIRLGIKCFNTGDIWVTIKGR